MTLPVKIMQLFPLFRIQPGYTDVRNWGMRSKDVLLKVSIFIGKKN